MPFKKTSKETEQYNTFNHKIRNKCWISKFRNLLYKRGEKKMLQVTSDQRLRWTRQNYSKRDLAPPTMAYAGSTHLNLRVLWGVEPPEREGAAQAKLGNHLSDCWHWHWAAPKRSWSPMPHFILSRSKSLENQQIQSETAKLISYSYFCLQILAHLVCIWILISLASLPIHHLSRPLLFMLLLGSSHVPLP